MQFTRALLLVLLCVLALFAAVWIRTNGARKSLHAPDNAVTSAASSNSAAGAADDPQPLPAFQAWAEQYAATPLNEQPALLAEGLKVAAERRRILAALIESNPEAALQQAVPMRLRQQLPPPIVALLEERVGGRGEFAVIAALPVPGAEKTVPPVDRFARINDHVYRAYVYGRRLPQTSRDTIPLHGIALDGKLALHESPVRALEPGEVPNPRWPVANPDEICGISGLPSQRAAAAQVGNEIVYLCDDAHVAALADKLGKEEDSMPGKLSGPSWTFGTKTLLFMRVNFTDDLTESISDLAATNLMNNVSNWFSETSYTNTGLSAVITPLLTLPRTKAWYQTNDAYYTLLSDARAVAKTNGFDTANFDLDCVHLLYVFSGWSGRAYVGSKGCWLQSGTSVGVAAHEFGHNYGLWHANFWNASGDTIIGPGTHQEYGNSFDTMGSASAGDYQFNAYEKNLLGWLSNANVLTITNAGEYRVHAFDVPALSNNFFHAFKIKKDTRFYWVELRRKFTSNKWVQNGVMLNWSPWAQSAGGSHLLDTTPGSPDGKSDSAVVIGRTFSDPFAGVHLTPVRKNTNTSPVSMDVVVNLGTFAENNKPTVALNADATAVGLNVPVAFTAIASDPDGDPLAYGWDFGDRAFGTNGPAASKSWSSSGDYVVRCTVSDMKGGTASAAVLITVGSPTTYRISGRITNGGAPLDGARVSVSSSIVGYTDANGDYILTGLTAGSNTVAATKAGWWFTPSGFANPVTVGPHATNIDFTAMPATYLISGQVTDNYTGVAGVTVSLGTNSVVTGGSGTFSFPNLFSGLYTLTASRPGYELRCAFSWTNPISIEWANAPNKDFERPLYFLSGTVSNVSGAPVVSIGDGLHETTAYSGGSNWSYFLQLPRGQWNLMAALPGHTIVPANFTNPVTITNSISGGGQGGTGHGEPGGGTGFNFTAVPGDTYVISGSITESGRPLPGVLVTGGAQSGFSDTAGHYFLQGLSNGNHLVSAALTDYTFTPPTRNPSINNADVPGQDFLARLNFWLTEARATNGGFQFRLSGGSNRVFRIDASTDLSAWESIANVTNVTGQVNYFEPALSNEIRFYRAEVLPAP